MTESSSRPEGAPPGARAMALVRWGLVALMALLALGALAYALGAFAGGATGTRSAASGVQYYCPMHPAIVKDRPGECPICGMTLVPKSAEAGSRPRGRSDVPGLAPVELTPERVQLIGVRTAPVVRAALSRELRTVGFVTAREDGLAHVHTRFAGWIEQLYVARTGDKVAKGQVLCAIYSPEVLAAAQELLNARRWREHAPEGAPGGHAGAPHGLGVDLESDARRRLENLGISGSEIDELERSAEAQHAQKLRSPTSGYVIVKNALQGIYVQPETELFQIADLATVWVLADIYEHEVARMKVGQTARVQVESYPGETFTGRVGFLYPTVSPETRTMRVRLELKNPGLRLRPGMYASVRIEAAPEAGLFVPASAVVDTGERQYLFVARGGGRFEPRRVQVGFRSDDRTEIRSGVAEGESVVTTANFLIDSESRLRAAIEGMGEGGK